MTDLGEMVVGERSRHVACKKMIEVLGLGTRHQLATETVASGGSPAEGTENDPVRDRRLRHSRILCSGIGGVSPAEHVPALDPPWTVGNRRCSAMVP